MKGNLKGNILDNGYDLFCANCGSLQNLHIHHITPRKNGGSDNLCNLSVLCSSCHGKLHAGEKVETEKGSLIKIYEPILEKTNESCKWRREVMKHGKITLFEYDCHYHNSSVGKCETDNCPLWGKEIFRWIEPCL